MTTARTYRTIDGSALYRFVFEPVGPEWHPVIVGQPSYGSRPQSLDDTHRLHRSDGSLIVCWDPMPRDLGTAEQVARWWAEATQRYLATGRFGRPGESLPSASTTRSTTEIDYHTLDGTAIYRFSIRPGGAGWRAYIVGQPPYAGRPDDMNSSHRLGLGTQHPYVCWTPEATSAAHAQEVARLWAEGTQAYIRHGSFPAPAFIPEAPASRS